VCSHSEFLGQNADILRLYSNEDATVGIWLHTLDINYKHDNRWEFRCGKIWNFRVDDDSYAFDLGSFNQDVMENFKKAYEFITSADDIPRSTKTGLPLYTPWKKMKALKSMKSEKG
jgi:hypothetical protein